ncbi:hypothetical protein dsx2_3404 [Desulfovibrio sp. X2]|uniref:hypothetical protein n=1 Tax=Desulfovibrio sp. X2 TaxID=941449 RepID=UPI000358CE3A|nr:hypothetical protein [Desulfovibrio sp. X2]EPR39351.1 hypothetical protein dsx2_3404 [Desulfovibrio sp. X2]
MQKIPLTLAAPGMILAKAVLKDNSIVIVGEGTELTDSVIFRLENMNVETITVEGNPVQLDEAGVNTSAADRLKRIDHLFRRYDGNEWMLRVKKFLKHYFEIRAAAEGAAKGAGKAAAGSGAGEAGKSA